MSYPISTTNSTKLFDLLDGTTNSDLGITLIGRNYTNYGEFQNENFVRLLENFASDQDPSKNGAYSPLPGTLWFDTANLRVRVYNGSQWIPVSERTVSHDAPTQNKLGDQWFSTATKQLFCYDGNNWQVIGPAFSTTQGKSGEIVETITDNEGNDHTVVSLYVNNNRISITSFDLYFVPDPAIPTFSGIQPGINLSDMVMLNGTVYNAYALGDAPAANYARTDIDTTFNANVNVNANLRLGDASLNFYNKSLTLKNSNFTGNIEVYTNTYQGVKHSMSIPGTDGIPQVPLTLSDDSSPYAVTNKSYVDQNVEQLNANIALVAQNDSDNLNNAVTNINAKLYALRAETDANLTFATTTINANVDAVSTALNSNVATFSGQIGSLQTNVTNLNATVLTLAPLDSAALIGTPTTPTAPLKSNSAIIASTAYVDISDSALSAALSAQMAAFQTSLTNTLNSGLNLKANIASPALTGLPTAPTAALGTNNTQIATTAFVAGAIAAQKFSYTVSTNPPSGGNNGDFWFQIG